MCQTTATKEFKFHRGRKSIGISQLSFRDDLLVVYKGEPTMFPVVEQILIEFTMISGLYINEAKS